ncbi:peptidyl-prolyl cis-trans isomerase D [mine drainage metagenome]|uniref:Periplasmic chaperone PpiD n=1 Tax=mine drainage metagenome TaxID=410659 RepID=T1DEU1_9ZZZZ
MLTLLRDKLSGWFAKILFGLLIIVFSFFGIEGYFVASHATWVARVGDHDVGGQEFQDALNRARQQQLQHNPQIDPKFLDGNVFKQDVLEGLIQRQMLINLGGELGVMVPDSLLRREIAQIPQFQVDGKFDPATYTAVLAANGLTPERFQEMERGDLSVQLLPQALGDSSIVPQSEIDGYLRLIGQTRDFSYVDLPVPQAASGTVSEAEIGAYYKAHAQQYMSPEQVSVQYVDLGVDNVPAPPAPSAEELRALYAKNQARFVVPSQYEVSHILIALPKNATPAQKAAALAQAQKVDALAHAPGANFAALARQYSDDLGSKNLGGSLGWLGLGDTDPAFQAAMIALKPGQVSAPVLTSDGYHIIELQAERAGVTKPFAEVKDALTWITSSRRAARNTVTSLAS